MKKLITLITALLLAVTLAACGGEQPGKSDDTANTGADSHPTYTVKLDSGAVIEIGAAADSVISALGEHIDLIEAPSCVHEGNDMVYTYDGYTVTSSPAADGSQYIAEISLLSDLVALDNGIMIGSGVDEVKTAFGEDFTDSFGVYKYTLEGAEISIVIDADAVSALTISSTRE